MAFIILIFAISMIVLGIMFMQNVFEIMKLRVDEAVNVNELINPPTQDNPLTISNSEITIHKNQKVKTIIAYMNTIKDKINCKISACDCQGCNSPQPVFSPNEYIMQRDQINTWTIVVELQSNPSLPCIALCSCTMNCGNVDIAGKSFMVTWK